jgi:hypothetical protein
MLRYNPEKFASLSESDIGQRIWSFLTKPATIARLETASELGKATWSGRYWNSAIGFSTKAT